MVRSKEITAAVLAIWAVFSLFYYNILNLVPYYNIEVVKLKLRPDTTKTYNEPFNESGEFFLNTPGCTIPNYGRTMTFKPPKIYKYNCERRGVFVESLSDDEIQFTIKEGVINNYRKERGPYSCCYEIVTRPNSTKPGINDTQVRYSKCIPFKHRTKAKLIEEVISVKCSNINNTHTFYEDAYIMIKKIRKKQNIQNNEKWNVLILGMDTMSRVRARRTLPLTMQFFKNNSWLDYKAYNKIGDNTYPNLMAILAGDAKLNSKLGSMDSVNDLLMWSRYKHADYITAYGEDYLNLPDTFRNYGGYEVPPTDHYMRPFFLLGEYIIGNRVCSRRLSSAEHMLDYAHQFTKAYENDSFFGFFWINSYSHNSNNVPELFDQHVSTFLSKVTDANTNNNTFIFFISDHGIRFGKTRYNVESFYEERLPMLYIWVPHKFREKIPSDYYNLQVNQNRLVTPYDLHATLWDILKKSNDTVRVKKSTVCPHCTSLFHKKSKNRTCSEAAIDEKWCSCRQLIPLDGKIQEAQKVATTAFAALKNVSSHIKTKKCTVCVGTSLKTLLRVHRYDNKESNKTHYVVAFLTFPGEAGYEVTVDKEEMGYKVNSSFSTITAYNTRGGCVVNRAHRGYCICTEVKGCHKNSKS